MLLRTVLGAVTRTVAGFGFLFWVAGIAAVSWLLLVLATGYVVYECLDLYQAERGPVLVTAALTAAGVSYALAALCVGRSSAVAVAEPGRDGL